MRKGVVFLAFMLLGCGSTHSTPTDDAEYYGPSFNAVRVGRLRLRGGPSLVPIAAGSNGGSVYLWGVDDPFQPSVSHLVSIDRGIPFMVDTTDASMPQLLGAEVIPSGPYVYVVLHTVGSLKYLESQFLYMFEPPRDGVRVIVMDGRSTCVVKADRLLEGAAPLLAAYSDWDMAAATDGTALWLAMRRTDFDASLQDDGEMGEYLEIRTMGMVAGLLRIEGCEGEVVASHVERWHTNWSFSRPIVVPGAGAMVLPFIERRPEGLLPKAFVLSGRAQPTVVDVFPMWADGDGTNLEMAGWRDATTLVLADVDTSDPTIPADATVVLSGTSIPMGEVKHLERDGTGILVVTYDGTDATAVVVDIRDATIVESRPLDLAIPPDASPVFSSFGAWAAWKSPGAITVRIVPYLGQARTYTAGGISTILSLKYGCGTAGCHATYLGTREDGFMVAGAVTYDGTFEEGEFHLLPEADAKGSLVRSGDSVIFCGVVSGQDTVEWGIHHPAPTCFALKDGRVQWWHAWDGWARLRRRDTVPPRVQALSMRPIGTDGRGGVVAYLYWTEWPASQDVVPYSGGEDYPRMVYVDPAGGAHPIDIAGTLLPQLGCSDCYWSILAARLLDGSRLALLLAFHNPDREVLAHMDIGSGMWTVSPVLKLNASHLVGRLLSDGSGVVVDGSGRVGVVTLDSTTAISPVDPSSVWDVSMVRAENDAISVILHTYDGASILLRVPEERPLDPESMLVPGIESWFAASLQASMDSGGTLFIASRVRGWDEGTGEVPGVHGEAGDLVIGAYTPHDRMRITEIPRDTFPYYYSLRSHDGIGFLVPSGWTYLDGGEGPMPVLWFLGDGTTWGVEELAGPVGGVGHDGPAILMMKAEREGQGLVLDVVRWEVTR